MDSKSAFRLGRQILSRRLSPKSKLPQDFSSKGTPRVDSRQGSRRRLPSIGGLLAAPKLLYFASMTNSKVRPKNGWRKESPYSMRSNGSFHTVRVLGSNPESPTTSGKAASSGLFFFSCRLPCAFEPLPFPFVFPLVFLLLWALDDVFNQSTPESTPVII